MLSRIINILNPESLLKNKLVRTGLVYSLSILYVLVLGYFITKEKYIMAALPAGLLILLIALYRLELVFWLIIFSVPFSIPLKELAQGLDFNMLLPTEPLLAGLLVIFIIKLARDGKFDTKILRHPVSLIILFQLIWIMVTSVTSTMPWVSAKFLLSRLWFVVVFYFIATQVFSNPEKIRKFFWVILIPLAVMVLVITYKHAGLGLFDQKASNPAVDPFFNDHTLYGAVMALFIPVPFGYLIRSNLNWWQKLGAMIVLAILLTGLVFSYSRAAWISLAGAIGVYLIILFRIPGKTVLLGIGVLAAAILLFGKTLLMKMEGNDQDSSDNFTEHVQSISNISTDASNLERLNRWNCAIRMFAEKPVFGFGPGTYMFQYAPFQKESQKTIISTNAADGGNAHSEFLGPLSESGLLGGLSMLVLFIYGVITGLRVYRKQVDKELKMVAIVVLTGLVTYFLHGIMNNFLDTDKASAGVWGFLAILVALDIKGAGEPEKRERSIP